MKRLAGALVLLFVAGCATAPPPPPPPPPIAAPLPAPAERSELPPVSTPSAANALAPPPYKDGDSVHFVLQVDTGWVWNDRLEAIGRDAWHLLAQRGIRAGGEARTGILAITLEDPAQGAAAAIALLDKLCVSDEGRICLVSDSGAGGLVVALSDSYRQHLRDTVMEQSVELVLRRLETIVAKEPHVRRDGDRITVDIPGCCEPALLDRLFGPPRGVTIHLVNESLSEADVRAGRIPPGTFVLERWDSGENAPPLPLYKAVALTGDRVAFVWQSVDDQTAMPDIGLQLDADGTKAFAAFTRANVGKRIAVVLDGKILTVPILESAIMRGTLVITGNFTDGAAAKLASRLTAGAGPAPWKIVEFRVYPPGASARRSGP